MEKKNTSPTVAEQKQILETCVHKLEEVNACILALYPTLSTNLPLSDYTNEELIAHELCEDIFSDFIRFGHILIEVKGRVLFLHMEGILLRRNILVRRNYSYS